MSVRKISLLLLILFSAGSVHALNVSVEGSCGGDSEPMISLENTDGGSIAEPGHYSNQVCVDQVDYTKVRDSCESGEQQVFSMEYLTGSNLSINDNYYSYRLCAPVVKSAVRNSCLEDETKALSVESDNNSRAASPSYADSTFDQSLCFSTYSAENVSLTLSGLSGSFYSNGFKMEVGDSMTPPISYPYIVDEQPRGMVGYGEVLNISRLSSETASITQRAGSGSFLLPFTAGGYEEIEDERTAVTDREFLNSVSPNFGFTQIDEPKVKVRYKPSHNLDGFNNQLGIGYNQFRVRNQGLDGQDLTINIAPY